LSQKSALGLIKLLDLREVSTVKKIYDAFLFEENTFIESVRKSKNQELSSKIERW
jgi:hypothetical protein